MTLARRLALQRERDALKARRVRAETARDTFKPRASDRGRIVLVGGGYQTRDKRGRKVTRGVGVRVAAGKGKKGFAVYVTKTGKKQLIHSHKGERYKPRKMSDLELPARRNLRRAIKEFQTRRLELLESGRAELKGSGKVRVKAAGGFDFTDSTVAKIAKSISATMKKQRSHRTFLIRGAAMVTDENGEQTRIEFELPIDRPDHIAIKLAGLENFVRLKFYAFMARELARVGKVSSGSANHIRRMNVNQYAEDDELVDATGDAWGGIGLDVVTIESIEWQIEQSR